MSEFYIEEEIFKRSRLKRVCLAPYGFSELDGSYRYSVPILDGSFRMDVIIDQEGKVSSAIHDLDFGDEYTNFRLENQIGEFVNKVREEHKRILLDIKEHCYETLHFMKEQSNRITKLIKETYGDDPEFLWDDEPGFGVFRNPDSRKWYAVIMNVDKGKLIKGLTGEVEIMNVKLPNEEIPHLIDSIKYFPAYHMNKKYWITILLDEHLKDSEIMENVDKSHNFSISKK